MKDVMFLSRKSERATKDDLPVAIDLQDTLRANADSCVGMAANMIGVLKNIIIVQVGFGSTVMFNPKIVSHSKDSFETMEGCLSLSGERKATRYEQVTVEYEDMQFKKQKRSFSGFTAQIIQHECDHLKGIII